MEIKNKKKYPPESAGQKMISNVPIFQSQATILDVRKTLFEKAKQFETLNYFYVVDGEKLVDQKFLIEFKKPYPIISH